MPLVFTAFAVHLLLLALASTRFTIVTWCFTGTFQCDFFDYSYGNGFGYVYHSSYSLSVVLAYLLAYLSGTFAFLAAYGHGSRFPALIGILLCIVGLLSFALEGTHWAFAHNLSWIASFPALLLALAAAVIVQTWMQRANNISPT
jgi:hypothetical protein